MQGVGYRRYAERLARRLGLAGWVRNRPDGTVELFAEGPAPLLAQLETHCRQGPPGGRVTAIEPISGTVDGPAPSPFEIRE